MFTEAWALGKPVVGCDIAAVRAVVDNGAEAGDSVPVPAAVKATGVPSSTPNPPASVTLTVSDSGLPA